MLQPLVIQVSDQPERRVRKPVDALRCVMSCAWIIVLVVAAVKLLRETLPEGFQRSEFLLEKGAIDMIMDRRDQRDQIARLLRYGAEQRRDDNSTHVVFPGGLLHAGGGARRGSEFAVGDGGFHHGRCSRLRVAFESCELSGHVALCGFGSGSDHAADGTTA